MNVIQKMLRDYYEIIEYDIKRISYKARKSGSGYCRFSGTSHAARTHILNGYYRPNREISI